MAHPNAVPMTSRAFYEALVECDPAWAERLRVLREQDVVGLFGWFPSPASADLDVVVWDLGDEPSLGFGRWHTHGSVWNPAVDPAEAIAKLLQDVLSDDVALVTESGVEWDGVVDLRKEDALEDAMTDPRARGEVRVRLFSGQVA